MRFFFASKFVVLVCAVLLAVSPAIGQETKEEKAQRLYEKATELISKQTFEELRESLQTYKEARVLFDELGNEFMQGRALVGIGFASHTFSRFEDATNAYQKAIKLFTKVDNAYWRARSLNNLGRVYDDTGQVKKPWRL